MPRRSSRVESNGKTWKVLRDGPSRVVHRRHPLPGLKDRSRRIRLPFARFEKDAAPGRLPRLLAHRAEHDGGQGDYTPRWVDLSAEPWISSGHSVRRPAARLPPARSTPTGRPLASVRSRNTSLVGWDEPADVLTSTGLVPSPSRPRRSAIRLRVRPAFLRVPAVIVSPWCRLIVFTRYRQRR